VSIVQLREPAGTNYACLPPADAATIAGRWYQSLPTWLTAWGWGRRILDLQRGRASNRLQHVEVVTRALPGWSPLIYQMTDYGSAKNTADRERSNAFHVFSPVGANGTTYFGDSGSGIVLRRGQSGKFHEEQKANAVGDVLYGYTTYGTLVHYSLNESGGEPKRSRYYGNANAIPRLLAGIGTKGLD
jgi:hypothetical protein